MTYQSEESQDHKVIEWMTEPQNSNKKLLKKPETPSEADDENWDWERDIYGYECANWT